MSDEFDNETLAIMTAYCGADPRIRKTVTEVPFQKTPDESWTIGEFLAEIGFAVASIPEELREKASVDLEGGYDEWSRLTISYERPETDAEVARRVESAHDYARRQQASERSAYERLKQKFG